MEPRWVQVHNGDLQLKVEYGSHGGVYVGEGGWGNHQKEGLFEWLRIDTTHWCFLSRDQTFHRVLQQPECTAGVHKEVNQILQIITEMHPIYQTSTSAKQWIVQGLRKSVTNIRLVKVMCPVTYIRHTFVKIGCVLIIRLVNYLGSLQWGIQGNTKLRNLDKTWYHHKYASKIK